MLVDLRTRVIGVKNVSRWQPRRSVLHTRRRVRQPQYIRIQSYDSSKIARATPLRADDDSADAAPLRYCTECMRARQVDRGQWPRLFGVIHPRRRQRLLAKRPGL